MILLKEEKLFSVHGKMKKLKFSIRTYRSDFTSLHVDILTIQWVSFQKLQVE